MHLNKTDIHKRIYIYIYIYIYISILEIYTIIRVINLYKTNVSNLTHF